MKREVFITCTSSFFPNNPVGNDEIENYLGMIGGKPSRIKNIILRQNGIQRRYYALNTNQEITHTNAELAAKSIFKLFEQGISSSDVQVLVCSTSVPDQLMPSHASMVHGLAFSEPKEIFSLAGVCMSGISALKTGYMSVLSGNSNNALCSSSELLSPVLLAKFFNKEFEELSLIEKNPIMAFEKDFLRYMLSDGASCFYLEDKPRSHTNLEIEWIETISYANDLPSCMYMWADQGRDNDLISWKNRTANEILKKSVWCIKQDVKLLNNNVVKRFVDAIISAFSHHQVATNKIRYIIPHISSMYFYDRLADEIDKRGLNLPRTKWFTNLTTVGNIGCVSIYAALDELLKTKEMENDDQILLLVPESGRFSYGVVLLTVKKNS